MKRVITLVAVVFLGIIVGVSVVVKQSSTSSLNIMLEQQKDILSAQQRIESKFFPEGGTVFLDENGEKVGKGSSAVNSVQLQALESRVTSIEEQMVSLRNAIKTLATQPAKRQGPPPEDYSKVYDIPAGASPVKGKKDAPVMIVEFVDIECPFCARFHKEIVGVLDAFPKKVKYMAKHFPLSFHKNARSAAKAALAANEQGKFFEMMDAMLEDNKNLGDDQYKQIAKDLGLNMKKFMKDLKRDEEWEKIISQDLSLGSKISVRGTPTFFINGKKTRARSVEQFKKEIESILEAK